MFKLEKFDEKIEVFTTRPDTIFVLLIFWF